MTTTARKEFWQMTRREVGAADLPDSVVASVLKTHEQAVKQAFEQGKPIPSEVLKDYPELKKTLGNAVTLSSKFATKAGFNNDMYVFDHTAVDKIYCIELAYGAGKTTLARVAWHTSFIDVAQIKSRRVPAGQTIYYRMMCSGANAATAKVGFRYFFE